MFWCLGHSLTPRAHHTRWMLLHRFATLDLFALGEEGYVHLHTRFFFLLLFLVIFHCASASVLERSSLIAHFLLFESCCAEFNLFTTHSSINVHACLSKPKASHVLPKRLLQQPKFVIASTAPLPHSSCQIKRLGCNRSTRLKSYPASLPPSSMFSFVVVTHTLNFVVPAHSNFLCCPRTLLICLI